MYRKHWEHLVEWLINVDNGWRNRLDCYVVSYPTTLSNKLLPLRLSVPSMLSCADGTGGPRTMRALFTVLTRCLTFQPLTRLDATAHAVLLVRVTVAQVFAHCHRLVLLNRRLWMNPIGYSHSRHTVAQSATLLMMLLNAFIQASRSSSLSAPNNHVLTRK